MNWSTPHAIIIAIGLAGIVALYVASQRIIRRIDRPFDENKPWRHPVVHESIGGCAGLFVLSC